MNNQIVTVNLTPGSSTPAVVRVSQGDIGRPIQFKVLDGTSIASFANSATATVVGTKPTGLGFSVTGTISGNTVTINTTLEMTQESGMIPTEIRFATTSPATDIGTANFILAVEPQTHSSSTTDGTYETMADLEARVTALEAGGGGGSGLTDDVKTALLQIAQKVAYIDANGQDYYDDLYDALYSSTTRSVLLVLSHVSSSNTQSTVEVGDSYITTLTASTNYTLNSVTVTMGGVDITATAYSSGTVSIPSVTGNIVITATAVLAAQSITATYTQSGTVYDTDTLDSLKPDLVVTANYSGGTSETVPASDYTLSGTLTAGTSTITVTYAGLTDTFSVTVSHAVQDTTAQIATSGKILVHLTNEYGTRPATNGGITVLYEMDAATTTLFPAGIIPTDSVNDLKNGNNVACLFIYDSNNEPINFVNELTTSSLNRWAQDRAGTMTEFSNTYTVTSYSKIAFSVDTRYLDDAYMYDKATGQVWFAGINTPYYGKHNISDP